MELLIGQVLPSVCMVLLLSSESNCEPDCTDIRLFNVEHRNGEGRVEILCNGQWGTISSDDTNIDSVICRRLGFGQEWRPNRTAEFGQGYGPVWEVQCKGRELKIQDCSINPTDPDYSYLYGSVSLEFFYHDNDIGVKCQGQYIGDLSENEELHEDCNRKNKTMTFHVEMFSSEMIVVVVVVFTLLTLITLILAVIVLYGFLKKRRFAVNSYASKEKDQSTQTLLSPSPHVTIQDETITQDQPEERGLVHMVEIDNHGSPPTEVNNVYDRVIEIAETSLVGERQELKEMTDSSDPVL